MCIPNPSIVSPGTGPVDGGSGDPVSPGRGSDGGGTGGQFTLQNPLAVDSIEDFLVAILQFIVRLGTIVVILMIVVVGFMFVTARGNPEKLKTAREALLWTLVGAVILIGAEILAQAIKATVEAIGS